MTLNSPSIALTLCCSLAACAANEHGLIKAEQLLKTTASWDGKQIVYPKGRAEVTALMVEIPPKAETGWHEHPVPSFGYIMEGELELSLANGEVRRLHGGDVLPESVGVLHNGRNVGDETLRILVFYTGEVGAKLSVAHPEFVP